MINYELLFYIINYNKEKILPKDNEIIIINKELEI